MRRTWAVVVAVVAVVAVGVAVVVYVLRPDHYTTTLGGVEVTAPAAAGRPTIEALAAVEEPVLPFAVQALAQPVRIGAGEFDGAATITMTYDPATLPDGADPAEDVEILTYAAGMWLPAGGTVDTAARTVSVEVGHFSDWVLAVTDPRKLENDKAFQSRLNQTPTGKFVQMITVGEQDVLDCDSRRLLIPARARSDIAFTMPLCQETLDDGSYRLRWVNTTGLPVVFELPDGFTEDGGDLASDALMQGLLQRMSRPGAAIVRPGRSLVV